MILERMLNYGNIVDDLRSLEDLQIKKNKYFMIYHKQGDVIFLVTMATNIRENEYKYELTH